MVAGRQIDPVHGRLHVLPPVGERQQAVGLGAPGLPVQQRLDVGIGPGPRLEVQRLHEGPVDPELVHPDEHEQARDQGRGREPGTAYRRGESPREPGQERREEGAADQERPQGLEPLEACRVDPRVDRRRPHRRERARRGEERQDGEEPGAHRQDALDPFPALRVFLGRRAQQPVHAQRPQRGGREDEEEHRLRRGAEHADAGDERVEEPPHGGMGAQREEERDSTQPQEEPSEAGAGASGERDGCEKQQHDSGGLQVVLERVAPPVGVARPGRATRVVAGELRDEEAHGLFGMERPGARPSPSRLSGGLAGGLDSAGVVGDVARRRGRTGRPPPRRRPPKPPGRGRSARARGTEVG